MWQLAHEALWVGRVAGAREDVEYRDKLKAAGFDQIDIEPIRIYRAADARDKGARGSPRRPHVMPQYSQFSGFRGPIIHITVHHGGKCR